MSSDVRRDEDRLNAEHPSPSPAPLAEAALDDGRVLTLRRATAADVDALLAVMQAAFAARPALGERPEALTETTASVATKLSVGSAYLAEVDGQPAGCVLVAPDTRGARLGRVSVLPEFRRHGIATFVVGVLVESLAVDGLALVHLLCRKEFPEIEAWWVRRGFERVGEQGNCWVMERALPVVAPARDADAMRALGRRLAPLLRAGDLIVASGDLGAGKTTFTQGLGAGLGVAGPVISPTFVLSRVHPSTVGGPGLVHVDAYRLSGFAELEDLDLEASLADSVTLVEWGTGVAEPLASDRLEIDIRRGIDPADETRWVFVTPIGASWSRADLAAALAGRTGPRGAARTSVASRERARKEES